MKKKMIQRGLLGFPLGIAIGFVITVIISMCIGDGSFYPVTPELIDTMKNELNAVILQTILCGIFVTFPINVKYKETSEVQQAGFVKCMLSIFTFSSTICLVDDLVIKINSDIIFDFTVLYIFVIFLNSLFGIF